MNSIGPIGQLNTTLFIGSTICSRWSFDMRTPCSHCLFELIHFHDELFTCASFGLFSDGIAESWLRLLHQLLFCLVIQYVLSVTHWSSVSHCVRIGGHGVCRINHVVGSTLYQLGCFAIPQKMPNYTIVGTMGSYWCIHHTCQVIPIVELLGISTYFYWLAFSFLMRSSHTLLSMVVIVKDLSFNTEFGNFYL